MKNHIIFQISFALVITAMLFEISCSEQNRHQTWPVDKTVVALIFCDLTTRQYGDSSGVHKIVQNIHKVMRSLPDGAKIRVHPVDPSSFVEPIYDYTKCIPTKPTEKAKCERMDQMAAISAASEILRRYRSIYSKRATHEKSISCLTRTLNTANDYFSQYHENMDQYVFELIYFSDMLEECEESPVGHVSFRKEYFEEAQKKLENFNPDFDLSYVNPHFIITVEKTASDSDYITSDQLKEIWRSIFKKVGFSDDQVKKFRFDPSLPEKLKK